LFNVVIIASENERAGELSSELAHKGFSCWVASAGEGAMEKVTKRAPHLVLAAIDYLPADSEVWHLLHRIKREMHLPVIALISREMLDSLDSAASVDDFVIEPWDTNEVAKRAKLTLQRTNNIDSKELIKRGDLVIDLAKCEVTIDDRLVMLTFKEYELLNFLASNKGRVFTRDALLNKVWGYDYFGGDRTVDVHIRRLRSKIEDSTHTFIETVRNIGYKFKES
jgi:DNA-binding response OmpR family regulator